MQHHKSLQNLADFMEGDDDRDPEEALPWKQIAEMFKERTDVQCLHRWQKVLNPNLVKGPWTPEVRDLPGAWRLVRACTLGCLPSSHPPRRRRRLAPAAFATPPARTHVTCRRTPRSWSSSTNSAPRSGP